MATSNAVNKTIIVVVVLLLLGGGYYLYQKNRVLAPDAPGANQQNNDLQSLEPSSQQQNQDASKPAGELSPKSTSSAPNTDPGRFSGGEEEVIAPDIQVWQIDYDGTKFAPQTLNIKVGDYVIFKNSGANGFWPASDPHPEHTGYPGFDAGKVIAAGEKYQFQFNKAGSWGFHNHLNPGATGTVNVAR